MTVTVSPQVHLYSVSERRLLPGTLRLPVQRAEKKDVLTGTPRPTVQRAEKEDVLTGTPRSPVQGAEKEDVVTHSTLGLWQDSENLHLTQRLSAQEMRWLGGVAAGHLIISAGLKKRNSCCIT